MKKLTTFFLTLLLALLTSSAFATTFDDGKVIKIGEPVTEVQTGQWYALYSMLGGWIYDANAGELATKAYWLTDESNLVSGMVANDVKDYILQLEDSKTEGAYYIKYANDNYMYMWAESGKYVWSWYAVSSENIVKVEDTEDIFAIHETEANYCLYTWAGTYACESWNSGTITSSSANNYKYKFYPVEIVDPETEVEWEMTSAGWGTMILPFDAEIPTVTDANVEATLTLYAGDALELSSDGSTITVGTAATTIAANTPYLVSGTEGKYTFTGTPVDATTLTSGMLTGTFVDMTYSDFTPGSGQYVLQNHVDADGNEEDDGLAFYPITSSSTDVTLDAYHCYLTTTSNFLALHLPGMETGIVAVESETLANDAIYDLSGRRVSKAVKGVYIQNGKKVLVK